MAAIEAERQGGYRSRITLVPLEKVANVEKVFPLAWLREGKNGVTRDFTAYCLPLIGMDAPEYAYLRNEIAGGLSYVDRP